MTAKIRLPPRQVYGHFGYRRQNAKREIELALRKQRENKPGPLTRVTTVIVLAAVIIAIWYAIPKKQSPAGSLRFYSDDDGVTWFADDARKIPPFLHDGKQAVLARVYQTNDGKQFVAYLEKYSDETRQKLDTKSPGGAGHAGMAVVKNDGPQISGLLVKKPHQGNWIPEEDPAATDVRTFTGPDGSRDYLPATPE